MLDYYNEVQKEALKRVAEKTIKEQVMPPVKEKVLWRKNVDKGMESRKKMEKEI